MIGNVETPKESARWQASSKQQQQPFLLFVVF
jgi:hypothetical protein